MPSSLETIPNTPQVQLIRYFPSFSTLCSVGKRPFYGEMEISYVPGKVLLEFVSFDRWLGELANQEMTVEDLARLTFDELTRALGDIPLCVTVHARTTVHAPVSATIERKGT
jgi:NADPH-dependent 7-cyano-7-deazaguanine reductase QueF